MCFFRPPATRPFAPLVASLLLTLLLGACADKAPPPKAAMPVLPVTALEMQPVNLPSVIEVMAQTKGGMGSSPRVRGAALNRLAR